MKHTSLIASIALTLAASAGAFPAFKEHVINPEAGTGLAITVADVNNDGKPDIIGVSASDVAWYENPTWERHLIADTIRNSNVCVAPYDLDGDGIPELALGADWQFNNTESGGALFLLHHGDDVKQPWKVTTLLEEEPTLHRIQWTTFGEKYKPELVVAPLKGVGSTGPDFMDAGVKLFALVPGEDPFKTPWEEKVISNDLHILHNVWPWWSENSTRPTLLAASMEGITEYLGPNAKRRIVDTEGIPIAPEGAGEIKAVSSARDDKSFYPVELFATIEPWHGHQAVVYSTADDNGAVQRTLLDDQLKGGHAIWFADFDKDGIQDLLVGFREKAGPKNLPGLNIYDLHIDSSNKVTAEKHVIDDGGMATEDALAADMNGDGWPDVVAFGRATHNIKYYENLGGKE